MNYEWLLKLLLDCLIFPWCHSSYPLFLPRFLTINSLSGHCYSCSIKTVVPEIFLFFFRDGKLLIISSPQDSFIHPLRNTACSEESKTWGICMCVAGKEGCQGEGERNLQPSLNLAWIFDHLRCSINISVLEGLRTPAQNWKWHPNIPNLVIPPGTDRTWYRGLEVREMEKSGPMHLVKSTKDRKKKKKKCYYNRFILILRFSSHFVCLGFVLSFISYY